MLGETGEGCEESFSTPTIALTLNPFGFSFYTVFFARARAYHNFVYFIIYTKKTIFQILTDYIIPKEE